MKKVVAALVAIAMILAMAPSVFAVTDSGSWMIPASSSQDWTATASGTVSLTSEMGYSIAVVDAQGSYLAMGFYPTFDAVEGETYTISHSGSGFDFISWELTAVGGNAGGDTDATSGSIDIEAYSNADWTAPQDGTVQFTINISGATLTIVNGYTPLAEGTDSVTAQVTAGTTYLVAPGYDVTTNSVVTWEYVTDNAGGGSAIEGIPSGSALALGDNNVALTYATMAAMAPYWTYTATENGYLTVTVTSIDGNTSLGMAFGRGMYTLVVGDSDGQGANTVTTYVNANDTVNICVLDTMDMTAVPAVLNLSFVAGEPVVEKNPADYFNRDPNGNYVIGSLASPVDIFVGNDDIYYTYTAESAGTVAITPTVDGYTATNCLIQVNGGDWASYTEPVTVAAGDVVSINVWSGYEGTVTLTADDGGDGGVGGETPAEKNPADYFDRDPNGNYVIGSLASPVEIFVGNDDIYYTYTAESAGTVTVTPTVDGLAGTNCLIQVNGGDWVSYATAVTVSAGDVVIINIWSGCEATVSMGEGGEGGEGGDNAGGGSAIEGIPSGSALALGDNNVALTYAPMPAMAPYWTYTATENGYLTVTVTSINGNTMLGRPFGMGMYTLVVGDSDGQYTNTATVYMNANDTVNVAVLDTMDMTAVPAVLNLSFVAGEPVVEKNPADYFDRDPNGNYVIGSLESTVNIFVGNDDIYYTYTAGSAGTVAITPTVDGYTATNCLIQVNGGDWASYTEPVTVAAGDVVTINVWNGYEGNVTFTAGAVEPGGNPGGASGEEVIVQTGTEQITAADAIVFLYTPDADGVLTVDISADPGFRFWVFNAATDESLTLPEHGTAGEYTYNLKAGVTYRVRIIGFYDWAEADATINYEISFKAQEIETPPVDKDKSEVVLNLGANTVDLLENTIVSLYEFIPAEPGIYTITVGEGVTMATYGFSAWNLITEAQNGVVTHTVTAAEQTVLIGLTADAASVTVTIEKTGNYTPPAQTVYENYVATNKVVEDFKDPTGLVNIDINKDQTVVLGSDGYYHLGSATGPVIYVNLNNEQFVLAMLKSAGAPITMRGTYVDETGKEYHYDFMEMLTSLYYDHSLEYDFHPLNKDLMIFLKAYGTSQGWYNVNTSSFTSITGGAFKADSAWLASCYSTVSYAEPSTTTNTVTGDNSPLMLMVALMMVSACGILVLVSKKKYVR